MKTLQSTSPPSKHTVLCEVAKQLYGQQYTQLATRSASASTELEIAIADVDCDGEKILQEKAICYLKNQMQRFHYSISQMVYNMGKLGG